MDEPDRTQTRLLGVRIDNVSVDAVLKFIERTIFAKRKAVIEYVNVHALNVAYLDPLFKNFLNNSDLVFCDGFGVVLGAKLTGQKIDHRFTPPDWIEDLCELAETQQWNIFFLGSTLETVNKASEKLKVKFPNLNISVHDGFFNQHNGENEKVIAQINAFNTQILVVGMGMPLQEKWISDNFDKLRVNVFFPVGAMFDYVSGTVRRGPSWLTDHGFEWLTRLVIEPKRLWKRYIIGNPVFLLRVLRSKYFEKTK